MLHLGNKKRIEWNEDKNKLLKETRNINFEMFMEDIKKR